MNGLLTFLRFIFKQDITESFVILFVVILLICIIVLFLAVVFIKARFTNKYVKSKRTLHNIPRKNKLLESYKDFYNKGLLPSFWKKPFLMSIYKFKCFIQHGVILGQIGNIVNYTMAPDKNNFLKTSVLYSYEYNNNWLFLKKLFLKFIGKIGYLLTYNGDGNTLIIAPQKSDIIDAHVIPTIKAWEGSFLVHDTQGEIHDNTRDYLIDKGYHVIKLDPASFLSCFYNPFDFVNDDNFMEFIDSIINAIIISAKYNRGNTDFFEERAHQLLKSIILIVNDRIRRKREIIKKRLLFEIGALNAEFYKRFHDEIAQSEGVSLRLIAQTFIEAKNFNAKDFLLHTEKYKGKLDKDENDLSENERLEKAKLLEEFNAEAEEYRNGVSGFLNMCFKHENVNDEVFISLVPTFIHIDQNELELTVNFLMQEMNVLLSQTVVSMTSTSSFHPADLKGGWSHNTARHCKSCIINSLENNDPSLLCAGYCKKCTHCSNGDPCADHGFKTPPVALFICAPPKNNQQYASVINIIIQQVLEYSMQEEGNALQHHKVLFLLDELAVSGCIDHIMNNDDIHKKFFVRVVGMLQNIDKMKKVYGDDLTTFKKHFPVQVYYNVTDANAAKFLSEMTGHSTTHEGNNLSDNMGTHARGNANSRKKSEEKNKLLSPEKILRIGFNQGIVLVEGEVAVVNKCVSFIDERFSDIVFENKNYTREDVVAQGTIIPTSIPTQDNMASLLKKGAEDISAGTHSLGDNNAHEINDYLLQKSHTTFLSQQEMELHDFFKIENNSDTCFNVLVSKAPMIEENTVDDSYGFVILDDELSFSKNTCE